MIRRRRIKKFVIPIASMGDIAFLLIIFFILTSNFMKQKNIELEKPASIDVDKVEKAPITVTLDKNAELWIDGRQMALAGLAGELSIVREQDPDRAVHVSIDRNLKKTEFMPVMEALSTESPGKVILLGDKGDD